MKAIRTLVPFLIIGGSIYISAWIFLNHTYLSQRTEITPVFYKKSKPFFETLSRTLLSSEPLVLNENTKKEIGNIEPLNLTAEFARTLSASIIGSNTKESIALTEKGDLALVALEGESLNETIKTALKNNRDTDFSTPINESDFIISKKPFITAFGEYSSEFVKTINRFFAHTNIIEILDINNPLWESRSKTIAMNYDAFISQFKKIPVPQEARALHKEFLTAILRTKNIIHAIRNYDEDPLKATIAIEALPRSLNAFTKFKEEINTFLVEF